MPDTNFARTYADGSGYNEAYGKTADLVINKDLSRPTRVSDDPENDCSDFSSEPIATRKSRTGQPGWVYVIRIVGGPFKIGVSFTDPLFRIKGIDASLPYQIETLGICEDQDAGALERTLHTRFQGCRLKGEWFNLNNHDLQQIFSSYPFKNKGVHCNQFFDDPELAAAWGKMMRKRKVILTGHQCHRGKSQVGLPREVAYPATPSASEPRSDA